MNDDLRWKAVTTRSPDDIKAAGPFYYAVKTTGVFCRPGCASRTPRRENVEFFETAEDAAAAGYRACRRCRPDSTGKTETEHRDFTMVSTACRRLENDEPEPTLEELAGDAGASPAHFRKKFQSIVGLSPHGYAAAARSGRLFAALGEGRPVTDAVYEAGYSAPSRAYSEWKKRSALNPGDHSRGGEGTRIEFTVVPSGLGWTLVAVTDRGIVSVMFDDDPFILREELRRRFSKADIREISPTGSRLIHSALEQIALPGKAVGLPLDIRGTAFQELVWQALREIPPGETATYGEIARRIGRPRSVRAVANACGANRIALFIPCHRAVRTDGGLGGYRWGIARKKVILDSEAPAG